MKRRRGEGVRVGLQGLGGEGWRHMVEMRIVITMIEVISFFAARLGVPSEVWRVVERDLVCSGCVYFHSSVDGEHLALLL